MYSFKKEIICFSLLLLSSCLSLTEQELTQNLLEVPTIATTAKQGIDSGYFQEGAWPEKQWWHIYNDSALSVLMQQAIDNNPSIQSIQKKVELARQNAKVVRAQLFPLLFFDATETWQYLSHNGLYRAFNPKIPIGANLVDLSLSFTYEFDFWSKNLNGFRAALGQAKADQAEAAQVELITTTAVAQAYFALKTNITKHKVLKRLTDLSYQIYSLQRLLKDKALYSKLVPLVGAEDYHGAQKLLVAIEEEIEVDKHLINILVGRGPDHQIEIDEQISSLPLQLTLPESLGIDLLARRPDLMAQIWRVEALSKDVAIAKADFYPNVNLIGLAGLESIAYSLLFKKSSSTAALKPAIHLPIFTAGAIRANVRAKKAAFDQAVFEYNQQILQSTKEVADVIVYAQSIYKQKELQEKIVKEASDLYNLVELRHTKGLDDVLSVYAKGIALAQKELEDIALLYNQYVASIKLIKSLGGGYSSEYMPIQAPGEITNGS